MNPIEVVGTNEELSCAGSGVVQRLGIARSLAPFADGSQLLVSSAHREALHEHEVILLTVIPFPLPGIAVGAAAFA